MASHRVEMLLRGPTQVTPTKKKTAPQLSAGQERQRTSCSSVHICVPDAAPENAKRHCLGNELDQWFFNLLRGQEAEEKGTLNNKLQKSVQAPTSPHNCATTWPLEGVVY